MGKKTARVRVKQVGPKAPVNPLDSLTIPPEEMIHLPPKPDPNITHVWPMSETFTMKYKTFHIIYPTYLDSTKTVKLGRRISLQDSVPSPSVFEISEALRLLSIRHAIQPHKGYSRDTESRWDNPGRVLVDLDAAMERIGGSVVMQSRGAGRRKKVLDMNPDGSYDIDNVPDIADSDNDDDDTDDDEEANKMNKKILMREIAKIIPTCPTRIRRMEEKKKMEEQEEQAKKAREISAASAAKGGKSSGGGGAASGGAGGHYHQGGTSSKKKKGKKKR